MSQSRVSTSQPPIFLLGFMASGKSTVGPVLAAKLNRRFIDLDRVIEAKVGCAIVEFIRREGEERFRELETETLREAASQQGTIIAPGGGAITREENRELMPRLGITVWLDAPFELCWRRIQNDGATRPLAPDEAKARERYEARLALYRRASIHTPINQSHSPDDISETIINRLREIAEKEEGLMSQLSFTPTGDLEVIPSKTSSNNDFDFLVGEWKIRNKKLKTRLNNCAEWLEFDATGVCHKILNGFGNTDQFITEFDGAPFQGASFRLFNPKTRLWSIYWADSNAVVMDVPQVGSFDGDVGSFYAKDVFEGKPIVVMFQWDKTNPDSPVWSQAFSPDNGATWEWNWYMTFSRLE